MSSTIYASSRKHQNVFSLSLQVQVNTLSETLGFSHSVSLSHSLPRFHGPVGTQLPTAFLPASQHSTMRDHKAYALGEYCSWMQAPVRSTPLFSNICMYIQSIQTS